MPDDGSSGGGAHPAAASGAPPLLHVPQVMAALQAHVAMRTAELRTGNGSMPFSEPAFEAVKLRIDGYVADLVNEARRIAQSYQADAISPAYVQRAGDYLVPRARRRRLALAGNLGALLLGAAMSGLLDFAWGAPAASGRMLATAVAGMLGAFMVALQFVRD